MAANERVTNFAAACFGAGCVTFLGLLMGAPTLGAFPALGIALAVGGVVGYFGYEFHAVLRAIPVAARATIPVVGTALHAVCIRFPPWCVVQFRAFTSVPRPFFWLPVHMAGAIGLGLLTALGPVSRGDPPIFMFVNSAIVLFVVPWILIMIFGNFVADGAVCMRTRTRERWIAYLSLRGRRERPSPIQGEIFFIGILLEIGCPYRVALAFYRDAWVNIGYMAVVTLRAIFLDATIAFATFIWRVITLVHSADRLIVMVDGPLGGAIAYATLRVAHGTSLVELPVAQQVAYVFAGGIVAVALGFANAKLVAPAILRLAHARTRRS